MTHRKLGETLAFYLTSRAQFDGKLTFSFSSKVVAIVGPPAHLATILIDLDLENLFPKHTLHPMEKTTGGNSVVVIELIE